jgi:hypothetical protein
MRRSRSGLLARLWAALLALLRWFLGPRRDHGPAPLTPIPPGQVAPDVSIPARDVHVRLQRAFATAAGSASGAGDAQDVVWADGGNELLVRPSRIRVAFERGFALIVIPVSTEQTGDVEIVVPFALGKPGEPTGLIAATESSPRGPAQIVDVWGDPLIAAAWDALLRVSIDAAAAAGIDEDHELLLPGALVADTRGLTVTPQARHGFDRRRL